MFYKKNTFANIYYQWRKCAKIFNWYSIFDNNLALNGDIFLKDDCHPYSHTPDDKKMFWHKHVL